MGRLFRDEDELIATASLSDTILEALRSACNALPDKENDRPLVPEAQLALERALGIFPKTTPWVAYSIYGVSQVYDSCDELQATVENGSTIALSDIDTGARMRTIEAPAQDTDAEEDFAEQIVLGLKFGDGTLVCRRRQSTSCLDVNTGKQLWSVEGTSLLENLAGILYLKSSRQFVIPSAVISNGAYMPAFEFYDENTGQLVRTVKIEDAPKGSYPRFVTSSSDERYIAAILEGYGDSDAEGSTGIALFASDADVDGTSKVLTAPCSRNGSLYALSVESGTCDAKALWRYDITADTWTNVGLPSGYVVNSGSDYGANTVSKTCFFALKGKVYLTGVDKSTGEEDHCIWCYDQATATWQQVKAKGIAGKWPSGNPIVIDDNLFFYAVDGSFYNFDGETPKPEPKDGADGLEGQAYVSQEEGEKITFCFALLDLEKGTAARVAAPIEDSFPNIDYNDSAMAVSGGSYGYLCARNSAKRGECYLMRLSYDAANKKVNIQDLTPAFKQAAGDGLLPVFERPLGAKDAIENHLTIAGLPDGVAIIGSSALGEDTRIIKEDSTEAVAYDKASCYHKVFLPMATWGDCYLYALGESDTEPDVMYLRSTKYDAPEKREDPEPTPTPTPEPTPTPTPTPSESSQRQTGGSGTSGTSSKQSQVSRKVLPKTGDVSTAAPGALALMGLGICVFARRMRRRAE